MLAKILMMCALGLAAVGTGSAIDPTEASAAQGVRGIITGTALPCMGTLISSKQLAKLPVKVTLSAGLRTIATDVVRGRHVYRFAARPGTYIVSFNQGPGSPPDDVTLHAGQTVRASATCYLF